MPHRVHPWKSRNHGFLLGGTTLFHCRSSSYTTRPSNLCSLKRKSHSEYAIVTGHRTDLRTQTTKPTRKRQLLRELQLLAPSPKLRRIPEQSTAWTATQCKFVEATPSL